jgi:rRNA-processing protein FCF1
VKFNLNILLKGEKTMICKEYLLDTNIVIKAWNKYPNLLDTIESIEGIDFKISEDIAGELSVKEYVKFNNDFVLSNKFLKLLPHIITNKSPLSIKESIGSDLIKYDQNKNMYFINGDKISINDYSLIDICEKNKDYILVTEDKKIIRSAKVILATSKILNFEQFLDEVNELKSNQQTC